MERTMKTDGVMNNIRSVFQCSGMTLHELGEGLGYRAPTAAKRAWFLLNRTSDPRISTVLDVAETLGVKISDLVTRPSASRLN
jgi:transcriptional regulator with XRE-family HTH domain